jgi:cation diffusion facilitator family transporter
VSRVESREPRGGRPAPPPRTPDYRDEKVRKVLVQILLLNLAVVLVKAVAWWSSSALSVAAETAHSGLDALNNVVALSFAAVAAREPDEDHPYGHQKFETLGALVVASFLSVTVFELVRSAVGELVSGVPGDVEGTPLAIGLMAASILVGTAVSTYERRQGRRLASDLLLADAAHTRTDVLAALAVLGGLVAVRLGYPWADPVISLAVAGVIALTGWEIVKGTVPVLVDERAVEARAVRRMVEEMAGVVSCYGVRSRGKPGEVFAELTIAVRSELDVTRAHQIADEVERTVGERLAARDVVVHVEPWEGE